jgi:hypothetical protein
MRRGFVRSDTWALPGGDEKARASRIAPRQ